MIRTEHGPPESATWGVTDGLGEQCLCSEGRGEKPERVQKGTAETVNTNTAEDVPLRERGPWCA